MKTYVQRVVLGEQKKAEKTAAFIRLGVFTVIPVSFLALKGNFPWTALPAALLGCYALVGVIGLGLALAGIFRPWFAFVYSTFDIVMLFGFFAALAQIYGLPLHEILRLPGASLIFLFVALAALRYQVSLIVFTAALYLGLWLVMVGVYGPGDTAGPAMRYAALPLKAEILRLAITVFAALIIAIQVYRTHRLLLDSIVEGRRRENLSKYLPARLVDDMAHEGAGLVEETRCQKAAVLFVDICGFTKMSENRPPRDVIGFLTRFRRRMSGAIDANGGTIDKFIGDAIMVVFGVPEPGENDARNALLCGVEMLKNLDDWNNERRGQGQEPVDIGIGIHYGEVIAGALGDDARVEYTVIGDTVNVAERIEALTRNLPSSLVISSALYDKAKPLPAILAATPLAGVKLKGRSGAVDVYAVDRKSSGPADTGELRGVLTLGPDPKA